MKCRGVLGHLRAFFILYIVYTTDDMLISLGGGPAQYWYDMLDLPEEVPDYDYGLKVQEAEQAQCDAALVGLAAAEAGQGRAAGQGGGEGGDTQDQLPP